MSLVLARSGNLEVGLARDPGEVDQAQRLRYRVFAEELGAAIGSADGRDHDLFDPYCQHLIARDLDTGEIVGTYRLLSPEQAGRVGSLYSDGEFWLTRLDGLRARMVELGRSCVHPAYRRGPVIMLLWSGLGTLLADGDHRYLIGCVSVPVNDGGHYAASLYRRLAVQHLADETLRVWPRRRLDLERLDLDLDVVPPPLVKGYLRAGAKLLGEPHLDRDFGCADFPMMLDLAGLQDRYQRRFAAAGA
ncbi:MAG: GNAT family N-acetyltransferase [Burkholderiaceae bacterium]